MPLIDDSDTPDDVTVLPIDEYETDPFSKVFSEVCDGTRVDKTPVNPDRTVTFRTGDRLVWFNQEPHEAIRVAGFAEAGPDYDGPYADPGDVVVVIETPDGEVACHNHYSDIIDIDLGRIDIVRGEE